MSFQIHGLVVGLMTMISITTSHQIVILGMPVHPRALRWADILLL